MFGDSDTLISGSERPNDQVSEAVYGHRRLIDNEKAQEELVKAVAEWENVSSIKPGANENSFQGNTEIIAVDEVINYFKNIDMSGYMTNIVPVIERTKLSSFFRSLWGPPHLDSNLDDERKLIFAIAACPFCNGESVHLRVLQSIYKRLTNNPNDCLRYGSHWEQIGFQGNDPSTDLRGVGFLGLVNLLYFVLNPHTLALARDILQFSHDEKHGFPFSVMGINLTRIVLQALREERLNKECNKQKSVINVVNEFYVGIFLHLRNIWLKDNITIENLGWVIKGIESTAKKRPKAIFRNLEEYIKSKSKMETDLNTAQNQESQVLPTIFSDIESEIQFADDEFT